MCQYDLHCIVQSFVMQKETV